MTHRLCLSIALIGILSISACAIRQQVVGSGRLVGESYDLANFDQLSVHGMFDVTVLQGEGFAVEVSADDNLLEFVTVTQDGDVLQIGLSPSINVQDATLLAVVHLPRLSRAEMHGASRLQLEALQCDRLDLELSGVSHATGEVVAQQLHLELTGASQTELIGQTQQLFAEVTGASQAHLERLMITERGSVEANGASMAEIDAQGELSLEAHGASKIRYAGSPTIVKSESHGASSIKPR